MRATPPVARLAALACAAVLASRSRTVGAGSARSTVDDLYNLKDVRDPQRSPDGKWVAYTVARAIKDTDKNDTDIWMVSWDGSSRVQLTSSPDSESRRAGARTASTSRSCRRARERRTRRSGC